MKSSWYHYGKYGFFLGLITVVLSGFQNDLQADILNAPQSRLVRYSFEYLFHPSLIAVESRQSEVPELQEESHNKPFLYNVSENPLPRKYKPDDLAAFEDYGIKVTKGSDANEELARKVMMPDLKSLIDLCEKETGNEIYIRSGFRSYGMQQNTFDRYGDTSSAYPGTSEHQLGMAVDIEPHKYKSKEFLSGDHPVYLCFSQHAYDYGFVQSYTKGNPYGFIEEPWHWRYVGQIFSRQLVHEGKQNTPEVLYGIDRSQKIRIAGSQNSISFYKQGIVEEAFSQKSDEDRKRIQELRKKINKLELEERKKDRTLLVK